MKQDEEHISFLDHIRGVAILLVFLYHSVWVSFWYFKRSVELNWAGLGRGLHPALSLVPVLPATLGWIGVAIFFVVSGFCIHLSHERSRLKSWRVFCVRRFFRIYPPYLLAMLSCALVYPLVHADMTNLGGQIVSHIFLYFNFSGAYRSGINASLWSIAVEAQLYLLYPLLLWLVSRLGWYRTLWITALIEMTIRGTEGIVLIYYPRFEPTVDFAWWYTDFPLAFWFSWSIGAMLAEAYLKKQPLPFRSGPAWFWPALFLACYFFRPLSPFCFTLAALSTTYLIAHLLGQPKFEMPSQGGLGLIFAHLRWTGIISYSAYLIHGPILSQVPKVASVILRGQHLHPLVLFGCCLLAWPIVFCLAYLFYRYVELPSIAWGKKIIQRLRETPSVPIAAVVVVEKP